MVLKDVSQLCVCRTCGDSDDLTDIIVEFTVEKWFLKMYHTCVFAGLAIYGHSDDETNIIIEFTSKNGSRRCITLVCLLDLW